MISPQTPSPRTAARARRDIRQIDYPAEPPLLGLSRRGTVRRRCGHLVRLVPEGGHARGVLRSSTRPRISMGTLYPDVVQSPHRYRYGSGYVHVHHHGHQPDQSAVDPKGGRLAQRRLLRTHETPHFPHSSTGRRGELPVLTARPSRPAVDRRGRFTESLVGRESTSVSSRNV